MRLIRWAAALFGVALLVFASIAAWFSYSVFGDTTHPAAETEVIIPRGSTLDDVARQLAQSGVIGNALAFHIFARARQADANVHAGAYRFEPHQTQSQVLQSLLSGGAQVASWVTIPEGFTAGQIAERLQAAGVGNATDLKRAFLTAPFKVDGTRVTGLEGYLFPSTYLVPTDASVDQIEKQLTDEFFKELPADAPASARKLRVTVPQGVIVASLIEREAKADVDRPLIAGVIYNRLRLGMPLQIDATIEYALPEHKAELSFADLKINSPYNTYQHDGLPPTPIANPGRPSLEAAFDPAKTDDLYYVYCGNGRHVFAKTMPEHQANVARCLH